MKDTTINGYIESFGGDDGSVQTVINMTLARVVLNQQKPGLYELLLDESADLVHGSEEFLDLCREIATGFIQALALVVREISARSVAE